MLGAEPGTCADTLLATVKGSRQALKTGLFHLLFNVSTILLALVLFPFFVQLVMLASGTTHLEQQVANGHLMFNCLGVILSLPFVGVTERILNRLFPDKMVGTPIVPGEMMDKKTSITPTITPWP